MIAVDRLLTVTQRVNARGNLLVAEVGRLASEADRADQLAHLERVENFFRRLEVGLGGPLASEPDLADDLFAVDDLQAAGRERLGDVGGQRLWRRLVDGF